MTYEIKVERLAEAKTRARQNRATQPRDTDPSPPKYSDEWLALRFAEKHADDLRFILDWNRWLAWDGGRWRTDNTLDAFNRARIVCRAASADLKNEGKATLARAVASAKTVAAVERLAKADRRLSATVDQWDRDCWLLNTPGGVIDLRTGQRRAHSRKDFMTKITAVAPAGECPAWGTFLNEITAGNRDLVNFLQRMIGYSLTGSTREEALFFLYGLGANGKSVFVKTVAGMLGEYAATAPMETFTASSSDRHPTELAGLRGARLVSAVETEEGRRWAEAKIKALTGGDPVSARFMRQDFFTFTPQFKLVIAGNHKPGLRGIDEAIRRRMNLVPFVVTIPPERRDQHLAEKLQAEWPGILEWAIEGCLEWAGEGLAQPEVVRKATDDYISEQDTLAQWLGERCAVKDGFFTTLAELYADFKQWADNSGEFAGDRKRLAARLRDRGFHERPQAGTNRAGFEGITLKRDRETMP